jgi:hypothetical protein
VKKDQEVVEWQLKEKETKAQLQEVDEKLKRERHAQMSQPIEPKKLLTLLPALREWLRSLKKVVPHQHAFFMFLILSEGTSNLLTLSCHRRWD